MCGSCAAPDDDHPEWNADERVFAAAWRRQPKWVVSRTLESVGANAGLVGDDLEGAIRKLKAEHDGEIEVAGPDLAKSLTELGLIDEYGSTCTLSYWIMAPPLRRTATATAPGEP